MVKLMTINNLLFDPFATLLKINNSNQLFPVQRVFCIGTNYFDHAKEMNSKLTKEPTVFIKPNQTLTQESSIHLPSNSKDVHHELELVVCLNKGGKNIDKRSAKNHIFGYAVGIDLTKRDIQQKLKKNGKPWELSKVFDYSAPISSIEKLENQVIPNKKMVLKVNKSIKQDDSTSSMIHDVETLISYISQNITLLPGDIIFTGTPAGVSKISSGDNIEAKIEGIGSLSLNFN